MEEQEIITESPEEVGRLPLTLRPEDTDLPEGMEVVEVPEFPGHYVVIDTEKVTRKWTKLLENGEDGMCEALVQLLVRTTFPYDIKNPESFIDVWPLRKFNSLAKAILEHISGPKGLTS